MDAVTQVRRGSKRKAYVPRKNAGIKRVRKNKSSSPNVSGWIRNAIIPPSLRTRLSNTQVTRTVSTVLYDYVTAATDIQYKGIYYAFNPKTDVNYSAAGFDPSLCDYYHVNWIKIIVQCNDLSGSRFGDVMEGVAYYDPDGIGAPAGGGVPNPNNWGDLEYLKFNNNRADFKRGPELSTKGVSIFVRDPWILTPYFQTPTAETPFARLEKQGLINNAVAVTFPGFAFMFKKPVTNFGTAFSPMFGYADNYYTFSIRKICNVTFFGLNI